MSFLGDLVGSIGSERPPAPPTQLTRPVSKSNNLNPAAQSNASKSAPSTPATARPVYKGTAGLGASQQSGNLKRKAEDISTERAKPSKPSPTDAQSSAASKSAKEISAQSSQNPTKPLAKPPATGSYAAMMARAKNAQSTKVPSTVGVIKHQATGKIKTSKLAERKRQDQEKDKEKIRAPTNQNTKAGPISKPDPRRRSASPVKKAEGPKQARVPQPPLHGPRKEVAPAYKGTMGQTPKKSRDEIRSKRRDRYDDYLGTDEEEDDDDDGYGYGYDDESQGYSSEGSDAMDAGFEDIEMEDRAALKAAKDDDARELALEAQLKREKEERKRKLAAIAKKHR